MHSQYFELWSRLLAACLKAGPEQLVNLMEPVDVQILQAVAVAKPCDLVLYLAQKNGLLEIYPIVQDCLVDRFLFQTADKGDAAESHLHTALSDA